MTERQKPASANKQPDTSKRDQLRDAMSSMTSTVAAVSQELGRDFITRGVHRSRVLKKPVVDAYGSFKTVWGYEQGCEPLSELASKGVGEVRVEITDPEGKKKLIVIGRTPDDWSPDRGGKVMPDAGEPGEYLMTVGDVDGSQLDTAGLRFRYLDEADLSGVRLANQHGFDLGQNQARSRQIQSPGTVDSVTALLA